MTVTTPLTWMVCNPCARTSYGETPKLKSTGYEDMKGDTKYRNLRYLGVTWVRNSTICSCLPSVVIVFLSCTMLEIMPHPVLRFFWCIELIVRTGMC